MADIVGLRRSCHKPAASVIPLSFAGQKLPACAVFWRRGWRLQRWYAMRGNHGDAGRAKRTHATTIDNLYFRPETSLRTEAVATEVWGAAGRQKSKSYLKNAAIGREAPLAGLPGLLPLTRSCGNLPGRARFGTGRTNAVSVARRRPSTGARKSASRTERNFCPISTLCRWPALIPLLALRRIRQRAEYRDRIDSYARTRRA